MIRKETPKRRRTKAIAIALTLVCVMTGCSQTVESSDVQEETGVTAETANATNTSNTENAVIQTAVTQTVDGTNYIVEYSDRDYDSDWSDEETTEVNLTDGSVSGSGVEVQGTTMTITAEGTYVFTGSTSEGNIVVNAPDCKIRIVLNQASLTSSQEAPIAILDSKKVVITLAEGTDNVISDEREADVDDTVDTTQEDTEEETDVSNAAIYAKENLTFNGTGKLTVVSTHNNGITSKDELIFMEGEYVVTAAGHGITGKDYLAVASGVFTVSAGKDGMRASNTDDVSLGFVKIEAGTIHITAGDDGIHAETGVLLEGGDITIAESYEGIEGAYISISGGTIFVKSSDDGLNATTGTSTMMMPGQNMGTDSTGQTQTEACIIISGGEVYVDAGGDGVDSNGTIEQTGGSLFIDGPEDGGNGALDYDKSYTMTGGELIAIGNATMLQTISDTSGVYALTVYYAQTMAAGTKISVTDETGTELISYTAAKSFNSIVLASDQFTEGMEVTVTAGDEVKTAELSEILTRILSDNSVETGAATMGGGPGGMSGNMPGGNRGHGNGAGGELERGGQRTEQPGQIIEN